MSILEVLKGDTHEVKSRKIEEYKRADVDGVLDVDGTLKLIDNPNPPANDIGTDPVDFPTELDLPTQPLTLQAMDLGIGVFLLGTMGLLFAAGAMLKNYAALIVWVLSFFALVASGLFGIGLEVFWALVGATVLTLLAGVIYRWVEA